MFSLYSAILLLLSDSPTISPATFAAEEEKEEEDDVNDDDDDDDAIFTHCQIRFDATLYHRTSLS